MSNLILDPDLRRRLQKAATEIGAKSLEDLAVALLDGGYLGKVKGPLEVQKLDRSEVGRALLAQCPKGQELPEYFRSLIPAQQHAIMLSLMHKGKSAQYVASKFWLPVEEVMRVWNRYAASIGEDVLQVRFESYIGTLALRVEDLYHRCLKSDRPKAAADIMFKHLETLQKLGVLYRAPVKVEMTMNKEAQQEVEREAHRIVELQAKLEQGIKDADDSGATETTPD